MPLISEHFKYDERLQDCLINNASHVMFGDSGEYVRLIQNALILLDEAYIDESELETLTYGSFTADAVKQFKGPPRNILGPGQIQPDDIVGKRTIKQLDKEMFDLQLEPEPRPVEPIPQPRNTLTAMDVLTEIAREASMGLTADPLRKLKPIQGTNSIVHEFNSEEGWKGDLKLTNKFTVSDLRFPIEMNHGNGSHIMDMGVVRNLEWSYVSVTTPIQPGPMSLPLDVSYALAEAHHPSSPVKMNGSSAMFPLQREIESQSTILLGWAIDSLGLVTPIDYTGVDPTHLKAWIQSGGFSDLTPEARTFVFGLIDFTLCRPDDRYAPKLGAPSGAAKVARFYPLLSLWSSAELSASQAKLELDRPARTMMPNMARNGAIVSSLFADQNDNIRTIYDDLHPGVIVALAAASAAGAATIVFAGIGAISVASLIAMSKAPSPRWDSIFAHYSVNVQHGSMLVVDRTKTARTDPTSSRERRSSAGAVPVATAPIKKLSGQGIFDNIHIAPEMNYNGKSASMAPICHHDCLHIHWRWSQTYQEDYMLGFNSNKPHSLAGAPHIPENQSLSVTANGSHFEYFPQALNAPAQTWQVFMHHGAGYVTELQAAGYAATLVEVTSLTGMPSFLNFYYHNRMHEGPPDESRLNEAKFGALERL
jgi:hypothetical protein